MRRLLPFLLLFLFLAPVAIAGVVRSWAVTTTSTSPFTGTVPTAACAATRTGTSATGLLLQECQAYYVCAEAASGQTLSGAGSLDAYFFDPEDEVQTREPGADEDLAADCAGNRRCCFPQREVKQASAGCAYWNPSGVTTSGGVTVRVFARCLR